MADFPDDNTTGILVADPAAAPDKSLEAHTETEKLPPQKIHFLEQDLGIAIEQLNEHDIDVVRQASLAELFVLRDAKKKEK